MTLALLLWTALAALLAWPLLRLCWILAGHARLREILPKVEADTALVSEDGLNFHYVPAAVRPDEVHVYEGDRRLLVYKWIDGEDARRGSLLHRVHRLLLVQVRREIHAESLRGGPDADGAHDD